MGTTVEQNVKFSDASGYFYEGMTKDDVENLKFKGLTSVFADPKKEFMRIDADHDGILSKDEITDEIYKDIDSKEKGAKKNAGFAVVWGLLASLAKNKNNKVAIISLIMAGLDGFMAIRDQIKANKLQDRLSEEYGWNN